RKNSIQPELGDVPRIGGNLTALDALDEIGEHRIGAAWQTELLALAHDEAVEKLDLSAAAFLHVLTHRGPLLACRARALPDALLGAGALRGLVAPAGPRDGLGRQMVDVLELIAERLADADGLAADPRREMPDRIACQYRAAGKARAGRDAVGHGVGD